MVRWVHLRVMRSCLWYITHHTRKWSAHSPRFNRSPFWKPTRKSSTLTLMSTIISKHSMFTVSAWTAFDDAFVREHLCKYDLNLTYPQLGHFPSLIDPRQTSNLTYSLSERKAKSPKSSWYSNIAQKFAEHSHTSNPRATSRDINKRRQQWKRDLINRPNGTLDPHYGCFLWEEMTDYAVNFSFPWSTSFLVVSSSRNADN